MRQHGNGKACNCCHWSHWSKLFHAWLMVGLQGGSVVRYLLKSGGFEVRALTRNAQSQASQSLVSKGVEVVEANLDDVDSLSNAFKGVYGVFGVTNYWEHGGEGETTQGKNMVDAAKSANVQHFIYSTMGTSFKDRINVEWSGDLDIKHFDSKARVNDYLIQSGIQRTSIYTAAYYENFVMQLKPKRADDGSYTLNFNYMPPDAQFFAFSGNELGAFVLAAFSDPKTYKGKDIKIVSEWQTVRQMAKEASDVTGLDIRCLECTMEDLERSRNDPWEGALDLYLMSQYYIQVCL